MSPRDKLLRLTEGKESLAAPGSWDALSAKLVQTAGFPLTFLTGGGITSSLLCKADIGVITMTEMVNHIKNICQAIEIPTIADGDSGFGNAMNAMRTVTEMEIAGVAGVSIEDRITPPNHAFPAEVYELFPLETAVKKIKAAVKGIRKGEIAVVARSDTGKIEETIARGKAYARAGAELFFPHGTPGSFSATDLRNIADSVGVPTLVNLPLLREDKGEPPKVSDFHGSLAKVVVFPREVLTASMNASMKLLKQIKSDGKLPWRLAENVIGVEFAELIEMDEFMRLTKEYLPAPK